MICMNYAVIFICAAAALILLAIAEAAHGKDNALKVIRGFVLDFILRAEREFGPGTGQFKKARVIDMILNSAFYSGLPAIVRQFISCGAISGIIDSVCATVFKKQQESNGGNLDRLLNGGESDDFN